MALPRKLTPKNRIPDLRSTKEAFEGQMLEIPFEGSKKFAQLVSHEPV